MAKTLTLRNVPDPVVRELRSRARRSGRSMQAELLSIVKQATLDQKALVEELARIRGLASRRMVLDEIHAAIDEGRP